MCTTSGRGPLTVIQPKKGFSFLDLREYWLFRELQYFLVWRDVKVKYKQAVLGVVWAILQPLATMVIFSVVFGRLAGLEDKTNGIPYPLFVISGLTLWGFFSNSLTSAAGSLVANQQMITKIYFPRVMIPWGTIGAAAVDLAIAFALFVGMCCWYGFLPGWKIVFLPAIPVLLMITSAGVGTILAGLTATYRDFRFLITFLIQLWLYTTPVIYPLALIPEKWRLLMSLNPMTGIIELFRHLFFDTAVDHLWIYVTISTVTALGSFLLAGVLFRSLERRFADVI